MPKQPKMWLDINAAGQWGIECDDPTLTFDGHYVCVVPHKDSEKGHEIANKLLDALSGRRQFKRTHNPNYDPRERG